MKANLAYLTSPAPNVFVLNIQPIGALGTDPVFKFEISRAHLANIVITGASLSLHEHTNSAFQREPK